MIVFGVTGAPEMSAGSRTDCHVMREASKKLGKMRLVAVGRGSVEAEELLREALEGSNVEVVVRGVLPALEIAHEFESADVMLFLRGAITPTTGQCDRRDCLRGSHCGVSERGNRCALSWKLASNGHSNRIARASLAGLVRVLSDPHRWTELHERKSRGAEKLFFMGHNRRAVLQGYYTPRGAST